MIVKSDILKYIQLAMRKKKKQILVIKKLQN